MEKWRGEKGAKFSTERNVAKGRVMAGITDLPQRR
jgi:hypothetical protein